MGRPQYEAARFFMGFGNSLAQLSCPLLLTEIAHPQHRGRITTVYNCLWNLGALICGWLAFGTSHIAGNWSWRLPTLLQGVFAIIQLCFIWWIPESPRWLMSKDRSHDALQMLSYYHADGNENDPTVQFEYAEIKETIRLEFLHQKTSSYLDFIRTKGNRYRLALIVSLGLISQWSGNALISYYASIIYDGAGITGETAKLGLDAGNKVLSLIVSISCALLVDRIGRRPLFLAATAGMLLFLMSATATGERYSSTGNTAIGYVNILFVWLHGVAYAFAWSGLLVAYTVEILPFKLRAKGLFIMNLAVQVALTINNQVNPIPISKGGAWYNQNWKLFAVYTGWVVFELVFVYFFYVETRYVAPSCQDAFRKLTFHAAAQLSKRSPVSSTAIAQKSARSMSRSLASRIAPTAWTRSVIVCHRMRRMRVACRTTRSSEHGMKAAVALVTGVGLSDLLSCSIAA